MPTTKALRRRQKAALAAPVPEGAADRIRALQQIDEAEIERRAKQDPDAPPMTAKHLRVNRDRRMPAKDAELAKAGVASFFSRLFGS